MKPALNPRLPKPKPAPRKPSLAAPKPRRKPTDIDRMRSVARRLLKKLESETRLKLPDTDEDITAREKKYHLMFGARSTYLSTLNSLADLLFKLEQAGNPKASPAEPAAAAAEIPMNPADMALVDNFVQRMKSRPDA